MTVNDFLLSERQRKVTFQTLSPYFGTLRYVMHQVRQARNSVVTFWKNLTLAAPPLPDPPETDSASALHSPRQNRSTTKRRFAPAKTEIGPIGGGTDQAEAQGESQQKRACKGFPGGKRTCMVLLYSVSQECHVSNSFLNLKDFERLSSHTCAALSPAGALSFNPSRYSYLFFCFY